MIFIQQEEMKEEKKKKKSAFVVNVREGSHLPRRVPEAKADGFPVDHNVGRIIVKDRRDIVAREGVRRVRNEQRRLAVDAILPMRRCELVNLEGGNQS